MVADGSFIQAGETPDWSWFNPHIRLVTLVCQASQSFFAPSPTQWTLCIVGSSSLYSEDRYESFLQVASWNGSEFKFYQVRTLARPTNGPDIYSCRLSCMHLMAYEDGLERPCQWRRL